MKAFADQAKIENAAFAVNRQSALKRRRLRAAYALNLMPLAKTSPRNFLYFVFGSLLIALVSSWVVLPLPQPGPSPLALTTPTRSHHLDRFNVTHTVRDGDTIWAITALYYGNISESYQQKLRAANPWLPKDLRQLKIGVTLKIPVI